MTHQQAVDGMASERYFLDEMSEVERFEFEAHYFDCVECAEDVRLSDLIRDEAQRGGADAEAAFRRPKTGPDVGAAVGRPTTKVLPFWRSPMVAVPWAAAAALALMVSYQSFVTVPALKSSIAPEPLAPVMLRGATRGTVPVVTIAAGQHYVTLAVDVLSPPQNGALRYELVRAGRPHALSGDAPLPSAGAPLMLLIPTAELERGARYSLIIRSNGPSNAVIGEYVFDVS
ncbi:MAG TPA: hypothetical protein VGF24_34805 [Vicinamibacterales bacterium]|jgi:hypothetical protein